MNFSKILSTEEMENISKMYPSWIDIETVTRCKDFLASKLSDSSVQLSQHELQFKAESFKAEFIQFLSNEMNVLASSSQYWPMSKISRLIDEINSMDPLEVFTSLQKSNEREQVYWQNNPTSLDEIVRQIESIKNNIEAAAFQNYRNPGEFFSNLNYAIENCIKIGNESATTLVEDLSKEMKTVEKFSASESGQNVEPLSLIYKSFIDRFSNLLSVMKRAYDLVVDLLKTEMDMSLKNTTFGESQELMKICDKLISASFIFVEGPPQVLKTSTSFILKVYCLLSSSFYGEHRPTISLTLVPENVAAKALLTKKFVENESNQKLLPETEMDFNTNQGVLEVLKKLEVKRPKRSAEPKKVTEEKFAILVKSSFKLWDKKEFLTISSPIVVIVHSSQAVFAHAVILWDYYFSTSNRKPFEVPEKVTWQDFEKAINDKLKAELGKGLTKENFEYLKAKILRNNDEQSYASDEKVSFAMLRKKPKTILTDTKLPETFLHEIYEIFKLVKSHLKKHWAAGKIHGFIDRENTENLLRGRQDGTFLLRFLESEPGKIVISWIHRPDPNTPGTIHHIFPLGSAEFKKRSLEDMLHKKADLLKFLYPDEPKHSAFPRNGRNVQTKTKTGYTEALLVYADKKPDSATVPSVALTEDYEMQNQNSESNYSNSMNFVEPLPQQVDSLPSIATIHPPSSFQTYYTTQQSNDYQMQTTNYGTSLSNPLNEPMDSVPGFEEISERKYSDPSVYDQQLTNPNCFYSQSPSPDQSFVFG